MCLCHKLFCHRRSGALGMKSQASSESPLLNAAGPAAAECASSEQSAVSSLLQRAGSRLRSLSPSACGSASAASELREPQADKSDADAEETLSWTYSSTGLVTRATTQHNGIRATVEIFPMDPDTRFYWAMTMRTSVANQWDRMFRRGLLRRWNLETGATAMGAEFWVCGAVGIPISSDSVGCEPHATVRELLLHNKRHMFGHFFENFEASIKREGHCFRCGIYCRVSQDIICPVLKAVFPHKRRDCAILGPPCQPFSFLSGSNRQRGASSHPLFHVVFPDGMGTPGIGGKSCIDFLAVHLPLTAIIEEVQAFGEFDSVDGVCWLRRCIEIIKSIKCPFSGQLYYVAVDIFQENPGKWMDMRRPRLPEMLPAVVLPASSVE